MNQLTNLPKGSFNSEADLFLSQYKPRMIEGNQLGNKNTYEQYQRGLTKLMEFMVAHKIKSIDQMRLPQLNQLQEDLLRTTPTGHNKPYSPKTVQTYLGVVKEFFYYLQNRGVLKANDFASFKIITIDQRDAKTITLTESELNRVMSHVMALPDTSSRILDKIIFLLLANTGLREEELCDIQVCDLVKQGDNLILDIREGKGMRKRFITLSPDVTKKLIYLRSILELSLNMTLEKNDYLIQSLAHNTKGKNQKPINRTAIFDRVKKISGEVDIKFSAHSLRRTLATVLYSRSVPIEAIQRMMGHESPKTTQGYIDLHIDKVVSARFATSMVG
jgi:integrase